MTDINTDELRSSAVIFAPHPDDETLGCGGTIIRKIQTGGQVDLVFLTDGSRSHSKVISSARLKEIRESEARAAAGVLGVQEDRVTFLRYDNHHLNDYEDDAVERVRELLKRLGASQVFVPCCLENIPDHRLTHRIVRKAIMKGDSPVNIYEYPVWFWLHWPWVSLPWLHPRRSLEMLKCTVIARFGFRMMMRFRSSVFIGDVLNVKRRALDEYRSQMTRLVPNVPWTILSDVGKGDFLNCFFQERELFYCYRMTPSPGEA
jgi:LmbE family N-acetylglucosaminyl deacetylase